MINRGDDVKKIICFAICLVLILGCFSVYAQEDGKNEATVYKTAQWVEEKCAYTLFENPLCSGTVSQAVEAAAEENGESFTVIENDAVLNSGVSVQPFKDEASTLIISGNVVLDLNGYSISQLTGSFKSIKPLFVVPRGSSLTVKDSSGGKGAVSAGVCAVWVRGGSLTLSGGSISAQVSSGSESDDGELPVKVTDGGSVIINGGKIDYNGEIEERSYISKSGAVYADQSSSITISGGTVNGPIAADNKEKVSITGGVFENDVSEFLKGGLKCVSENGKFVPEKSTPVATATYNGSAAETTVEEEFSEEGGVLCGYTVSAKSATGFRKNTEIDLSDIAKRIVQENRPVSLTLKTDIADLYFESGALFDFLSKQPQGGLKITIEKETAPSSEVTSLMATATERIRYSFSDENGENVSYNGEIKVVVPYLSGNIDNAIYVYKISGNNFVSRSCGYSSGELSYETTETESVLITEGSRVQIQGRALDLKGTISLVYYAQLDNVDEKSARMLFWDTPQTDYTEATASRIVSSTGKTANGYKFEYGNISSKDMTKTVYARISATDRNGNKIYSDEPKSGYSVAKYAENMMNDEKLRPLVIKMLNYGAAAQEYFGSELETANAALPESSRAIDYTKVYKSRSEVISEETARRCQSEIKGKTLVLDGDISINYYTTYADADAEEYGMLFWTENAFKNTQSHVFGTQTGMTNVFETSGSYKVFAYKNIVSSAMNSRIYARLYVKDKNGYSYSDISSYSVSDYVANQISKNSDEKLIKLLRCLMLYGEEAEKYFGGENAE